MKEQRIAIFLVLNVINILHLERNSNILKLTSFDKYKCAVYRVTKNRRELFMANEKKVYEIIKEAGFKPIEDKGIVVKYAPENLSAKIANFFSMEFYVLQLCEDELVLVPFSTITAGLKKEVTLQLPYSAIKSVTVNEDMLNYQIVITTETDTIRLTAQQKELSGFRSTGMLAFYSDGVKMSNWHKENLDSTLNLLKSLTK